MDIQTNNKNLMFTCPHCGKETNLLKSDEFRTHVENYIVQQQFELIEATKKQEQQNSENILQSTIENLQKELQIEKSKIEFSLRQEMSEKINNLNQELQKNNHQFEIEKQKLIEEKTSEIQALKFANEEFKNNAELKYKAEYQDVINELKNKNEQLSLATQNELEKLASQYSLDLEKTKSEIDNKYRNEIESLKIANAQNKIIHSKTKGENFEIEVETELRKCFGMNDAIDKINISVDNTKADFKQSIKFKGDVVGTIIYEVKNAVWSDNWEEKLNSDIAKMGHKYGILIATSFNDKYKGIPFTRSIKFNNIWITDSESFVFVAQILKNMILAEHELQMKIKSLNKIIDDSSNNELNNAIKAYEDKIKKLELFCTSDIPQALKICRKELINLESVSRTLNSASQKTEKAKERIEKQLFKKIIEGLSKILDNIAFEVFDEDKY
ncbi:hypothetical protein ESOMN_v1c05940 [Williamsoniiplasma somnilux]|uniref:DUF2130 domain-containing protein n=1 Tax=Williamsoniiplasma somnilux TaxID=215578 RepID=A0A2K8NZK3_9MOLU|nr:DUF2130 domain-containing protein [Williamsoniiplasma somnilux]ATZ18976.1 hypothetical protein ESOMN_v1c05940 [Williamsoniiplasma somnilux]